MEWKEAFSEVEALKTGLFKTQPLSIFVYAPCVFCMAYIMGLFFEGLKELIRDTTFGIFSSKYVCRAVFGVKGFEPLHVGIKNRCLSTWLYSSMVHAFMCAKDLQLKTYR